MAKFIHSIIEPERLIVADGEQIFDLPVNPLSAILLTITPLNESGTITTYRLLELLLGAITNVDIVHKGSSVIDATLTNLAVKALLFDKLTIWQSKSRALTARLVRVASMTLDPLWTISTFVIAPSSSSSNRYVVIVPDSFNGVIVSRIADSGFTGRSKICSPSATIRRSGSMIE